MPKKLLARPTCCERAKTCGELDLLDVRDLDRGGSDQQTGSCWAMIVDIMPDSPRGYTLERGRVDFCPFCGTRLSTVPPPAEPMFYILSMKRPTPYVLTWYRPEKSGYTIHLGQAGKYTRAEVQAQIDDPDETLVIPCEVADAMTSLIVPDEKIEALRKVALGKRLITLNFTGDVVPSDPVDLVGVVIRDDADKPIGEIVSAERTTSGIHATACIRDDVPDGSNIRGAFSMSAKPRPRPDRAP